MAKTNNFGSKVDNASSWHKNALKNLTNLIQKKIFNLQHPKDCLNGKLVYLNKQKLNIIKLN